MLTSGDRTAEARQRTLRSAVDWSHDLLTREERVLFRRLAVFRGGWTLTAAETVVTDTELPRSGCWSCWSGWFGSRSSSPTS